MENAKKETWKPVCHKESYDNPSTYGNEVSYKNHWRMARTEGGKVVAREMAWYERLHYGKGFPLEMESWGVGAWVGFTFVACLLLSAAPLPAGLSETCFQVCRFIVIVTVAFVALRIITALVAMPLVERRNRKSEG